MINCTPSAVSSQRSLSNATSRSRGRRAGTGVQVRPRRSGCALPAIHQQRLARPELESLAEYAWAAYSNQMYDLDEKAMFKADARFGKYFSLADEIRIHFLGVFDTVSSFGWIWNYRTLPNTADNPSVAHVRHAVAIDERRACFGANLFQPKDPGQHESFREVWFAGVHADVGGGYPEDDAGLSKIPLQWMLHEAEAQGLQLDKTAAADILGAKTGYSKPDCMAELHNSLTGLWRVIECSRAAPGRCLPPPCAGAPPTSVASAAGPRIRRAFINPPSTASKRCPASTTPGYCRANSPQSRGRPGLKPAYTGRARRARRHKVLSSTLRCRSRTGRAVD
jgi:hypothetical protein